MPALIIAGKGQLEPRVASLIDELGLTERVTVYRDVPYDELPALLRSGAVFVQTSYEEGLGISVIEAMASGLPVVATMTAGSAETVDPGVTGLLIPQTPKEDVATALANATAEVLRNSGERFGSAGRRRSEEKFGSTVALSKYLNLYRTLIVEGESP